MRKFIICNKPAQSGQGADWGIKQPVTAHAGLDGPDLHSHSVTLFAVYRPTGG